MQLNNTTNMMKQTTVLTILLGALSVVSAQERLSQEEALKYATIVSADAKQLKGTPIPTDVDTKKPVAVREEDFGGMVLPQKNLTAESLAKAGKEVTPVGQLWLYQLTPMKDGEAIGADKLRLATLNADGTEVKAPQCALGVRRTEAGTLELLVFGKGKEPLLTAPLKAIDTKQEMPLDITAVRESESGKLTLKILGKYQASIHVTLLDT
jgi:hypothetical protein